MSTMGALLVAHPAASVAINNLTVTLASVVGGVVLIIFAYFLRRIRKHWVGTTAVIAAIGAVFSARLWLLIINVIVLVIQVIIGWLGSLAANIPQAGGNLSTIAHVVQLAIPWVIALIMPMWFLIHMFPRIRAMRTATGGIGERLQQLHGAESHTYWLAIAAPASLLLLPPLAALIPPLANLPQLAG